MNQVAFIFQTEARLLNTILHYTKEERIVVEAMEAARRIYSTYDGSSHNAIRMECNGFDTQPKVGALFMYAATAAVNLNTEEMTHSVRKTFVPADVVHQLIVTAHTLPVVARIGSNLRQEPEKPFDYERYRAGKLSEVRYFDVQEEHLRELRLYDLATDMSKRTKEIGAYVDKNTILEMLRKEAV